MTFRSWILTRDGTSAKRLDGFDKNIRRGDRFGPARFGQDQDGSLCFWIEEPYLERLAERLRKSPVLAFSLESRDRLYASLENGCYFKYPGGAVRVLKASNLDDEKAYLGGKAYGARILRLEHSGSSSAGRTAPVIQHGPVPDNVPELFLAPIPVEKNRKDMADWAASALDWKDSYHDDPTLLLPPVLESHDSQCYFSVSSENPRRLARKSLRESLRLEIRHPNEPLGVTLWRLQDSPVLRDILVEGGGLGVSSGNTGTSIVLELPDTSQADYIPRWRALVLANEVHLGPRWGDEVARVLRQDIVEAGADHGIPNLELRPAAALQSWTVPPGLEEEVREAKGSGLSVGAVNDLEKLVEITRELTASTKLASYIDTIAVRPARSNRNHVGAERLFVANFFRCPSAGADWVSAWQDWLVPSQLLAKWFFEPVSPSELLRDARIVGVEVETLDENCYRVWHHADDKNLLRWQLLMPLGTQFIAGGVFALNGRSALSKGYVLG